MFSWLKSKIVKDDIEFVDTTRMAYLKTPILLAKNVPTHFLDKQKEISGKYKFAFCPGMHDYARYGYIVPAWEDFHIKTNKAGSSALIGGNRGSKFKQPVRMDSRIVDGVFHLDDGIDLHVWKYDSPWSIFVNKNISCFLMPAFYHSKFLQDVFIYPGIVDYTNKFHTINLIFALKRDCEIHIKQGEPVLHVIPFQNKEISGSYRPGDQEHIDSVETSIPNSQKAFYRKHLSIKKKFSLDKRQDD